LWLQSLGAQVIGYAHNPPTTPNLFDLAKVEEGIVSVIGDIRNFEALKKVFDEHKPEIVIHLAAQSLVKYSYNNPVETYSTNVMGTINLLEAVRQSQGIKVVLNVMKIESGFGVTEKMSLWEDLTHIVIARAVLNLLLPPTETHTLIQSYSLLMVWHCHQQERGT